MEIRFSRSWALALAAVTLTAATADAQARPRSTRSIPVRKDVPPPPPRVDTVYQTRTDTVTRYMRDTVMVTRYDTVTRTQTVPMTFARQGGWYWGLGAGGSPTVNHLDNGQVGGPHLMGMIGWDQLNGPLGLRFDGTWNRFETHDLAFRNNNIAKAGEPTILTLGGDVTLNLPINPTTWNNVKVYALGGLTYNRYKNVAMIGNPGDARYITDWSDDFGWQAGGGFAVGIGNAAMFVESRYVRFNVDQAVSGFRDAGFIPITAGFRF